MVNGHFISKFSLLLQGERREQETLIVLCCLESPLIDIFNDRTVYCYDNVFFIDKFVLTHNMLCVPPHLNKFTFERSIAVF